MAGSAFGLAGSRTRACTHSRLRPLALVLPLARPRPRPRILPRSAM